VTPTDFANAFLNAIPEPDTADNVEAIVGWEEREGGNWENDAKFNPLDTTTAYDGSTSINSVGVQAFNNWDDGVTATVITIENGHYAGILAALAASDNADNVAAAVGASPWGTPNYTDLLPPNYNPPSPPWQPSCTGPPGNGSFVQVSGSSAIYEIAGGAPLYVSSWSAVGGSQPYTVISQAQFDSLNSVPANGTFIRDEASGQIWVVAGGAPLYVAGCGNLNGCAGAVNIDVWDVQNAGNPASHLNPVPANGTFIRDPASGQIWIVAGGAPLAVASCANLNGCPNPVNIDPYAVNALDHLNAVPANGTFVQATTGNIYRIAGGTPFAVSSWSVFGGQQPFVMIDEWDIDNITNPAAHLNQTPADGTVVEGLPSDSYWLFTGGYRSPTSADSAATTVDDVGLAAFPETPAKTTPTTTTTTTTTPSTTTTTTPSTTTATPSTTTTTATTTTAKPATTTTTTTPGTAPSTPGRPSESLPSCLVPNLHGMTLGQARSALNRAHCRLGEVHEPKRVVRHHVLRVTGQSARVRTEHAANYRVNITLK
jgi:hypothetical protein